MDWEPHLNRWVSAVIDPDTANRISAFESGPPDNRRMRWPVVVALSFGGLLVASGLCLFVAAHWDTLSPLARMTIVVAAVIALHGIGAYSAPRFPNLATTMHTIGTVGLGGAIALAGQIFHMDEHWPAAILVWAIGAWAAYALLRDLPQLALAATLTPAWLASEATAGRWWDAGLWVAPFLTVMALAYMSACGPGENSVWRWLLTLLGSLALLPVALWIVLAGSDVDSLSWSLLLAFVPATLAYAFRGRQSWPVLAGAVWAIGQAMLMARDATVLAHAWAAAASVGLVAWGIQEMRRERINLGIAGFALTVLFFYFSRVMDSIDRSLSLIVLGVLFLAGGWQLERLRRRLIDRIAPGAAA